MFQNSLQRALWAAVFLVLLLSVVGCGPFYDPSLQYDHATEPAGPPGAVVSESFRADCDGLTAVDVQVARYPTVAAGADSLRLLLTRQVGGAPETVASGRFAGPALAANGWIRFAFPAVPNSRGGEFGLMVVPAGSVTIWADGAVADPRLQRRIGSKLVPGALVARLSCDVSPVGLASQTASRLAQDKWLWPIELGLTIIPGLAVALVLAKLETDPLVLVGRGVGWSVLLAPLALVALTLPSAGQYGGALLLVGGFLALLIRLFHSGGSIKSAIRRVVTRVPLDVWLLGTIALLGGLTLRVVQVRDVSLPMWVDSPQHSYVVGQILARRGLPATYGALVPPQVFDYHFGFQALAAYGSWLSGAGPGRAVLATGQLLSGVLCLAVYALMRDLEMSPRAAAVSALLVGLVTTYPTYYVTWGRYPELAGLVALPAAYASLTAVSEKGWRRRDFVAAALAAIALILVHPRVAEFLAALLIATFLIRRRWTTIDWVGVTRAVAAGVLGLILGLPWLIRLWRAHHVATLSGVVQTGGSPMIIPTELLFVGNDTVLIAIGGVAAVVAAWRRPRFAATIVIWCGLVILVANLNRLGLPINLWLDGNSIAIAAFIPAVVLVGFLAGAIAERARIATWRVTGRVVVVAAVAALALSRWPGMLTLVNPCCRLVGPGDLAAMAWVREYTPPSARFLINGYLWQDDVWAGSDAGSWLPVVADRRVTLPPMFYAVGPARQVQLINDQARFFATTTDPTAIARAAGCLGIDYVFIGAKGGSLDPVHLVASGRYKVDYRAGGAWVLELVTPGGAASDTVTSCIPTAGETPSRANAAGLRSTTRG